jgi:hypothetical protein
VKGWFSEPSQAFLEVKIERDTGFGIAEICNLLLKRRLEMKNF